MRAAGETSPEVLTGVLGATRLTGGSVVSHSSSERSMFCLRDFLFGLIFLM